MTEEQIISRFDALRDEDALRIIYRIVSERFDAAADKMFDAVKEACFSIAEDRKYGEHQTDELMCRVFGKPVKWWKEAA